VCIYHVSNLLLLSFGRVYYSTERPNARREFIFATRKFFLHALQVRGCGGGWRGATFSIETSLTFGRGSLLIPRVMEEYPFMSRNAFNQLAADFLKTCKRIRKAVITEDDYNLIIRILKDPDNTSTATPKERYWAKTSFYLRDIGTPQNPVLQVMVQQKGADRIVYPFEKLYDVLGRIHGDVSKHAGSKKMYEMVSLNRISIIIIIIIIAHLEYFLI